MKNHDGTYMRSLVEAILTGMAITFEARRREVGLGQARVDTLAAMTGATETVYYSLVGNVADINRFVEYATALRLAGEDCPVMELSDDAGAGLIAMADKIIESIR